MYMAGFIYLDKYVHVSIYKPLGGKSGRYPTDAPVCIHTIVCSFSFKLTYLQGQIQELSPVGAVYKS